MSLHFWQFCGTKTLGLSPTPVQLGVQRSHLPESTEHLAPGPHKRSRGCGRGAAQGLPGLEGQQVRQPRARQHLNSSLFFHSHSPLPSSGNALGTELLSLRNYQGKKKYSLVSPSLELFCSSLPSVGTGPTCAGALRHAQQVGSPEGQQHPHGPLLNWDSRRRCQPLTLPSLRTASGQPRGQDY